MQNLTYVPLAAHVLGKGKAKFKSLLTLKCDHEAVLWYQEMETHQKKQIWHWDNAGRKIWSEGTREGETEQIFWGFR